MGSYKYTAMSAAGKRVNGTLDAPDQPTAIARIRAQYPVIVKVAPVGGKRRGSPLSVSFSKKIDAKALSVMCSQFSIMLQSGMNVASCMEMISNQTEDKKLKTMLYESSQDVAQGASVAASFEKNCKELPLTFIETVRAGEISGTMEQSFKTMESYYSKSYLLAQKIKSAMSYPLFVLVVAIVVLFIIMIKVIPTLTSVFTDLGGELPPATQILIGASTAFRQYWWLIAGVLIAIVAGWVMYGKTERERVFQAKLMLKLPVLGKINSLNGAAQFANTMSTLLKAGLPVSNAMETTGKILDNYVLAQDVSQAVTQVESGYRLGDCIRKCEHFPQILQEMTAIGEETGELEQTLDVIGDYYTNESDYAVQKAISKLEPTILVFLALLVGYIVIAIYLPMFTMYDLM